MPLEIRLLHVSEYPAVNDFLNQKQFQNASPCRRIRSFGEFSWEYLDAPGRRAIFAGAWETEPDKEALLAGVQCMILHHLFSADGNPVLAAKGEDTAIATEALRKYGTRDILGELHSLLHEECKRSGVIFLWGLNSIPATYHRLGFKTPFRANNSILILKPGKAFRNIISFRAEAKFFRKLKFGSLTTLSYLYSIKRKLIPIRQKKYPVKSCVFDNSSLFKRISVSGNILFLHQDGDYLNWRVRNNPYPVAYRSFQLIDGNGSLAAQVICSITGRAAFIEQALFDDRLSRKAILSVLRQVIRSLQKENVVIIRHIDFNNSIPGKMEAKFLARMGFVRTGSGDWFTFKTLTGNPVIAPETIYLSRLYKQGRT